MEGSRKFNKVRPLAAREYKARRWDRQTKRSSAGSALFVYANPFASPRLFQLGRNLGQEKGSGAVVCLDNSDRDLAASDYGRISQVQQSKAARGESQAAFKWRRREL